MSSLSSTVLSILALAMNAAVLIDMAVVRYRRRAERSEI